MACAKYETDPDFSASRAPGQYAWHPSVRNPGKPDVLYGTAYAQSVIWDHQHPADCTDQKYLVMYHWVSGIGSLLHFLGRALGLAMHLGRILVLANESHDPAWGTLGMPWYDGKLCPGKTSWECWFLPLSNCTPHGRNIKAIRMDHLGRFRKGNFTRHYVPDVFQELIRDCSRVKRDLGFHWWHAQAITYIMRFNSNTRRLLDDLRAQLFRVRRRGSGRLKAVARGGGLPRGAVAMHVRHGDKFLEVPVLQFEQYLAVARELAAGSEGIPVLNPMFADSDQRFLFHPQTFKSRVLFVSTEDPQVILEAARLTRLKAEPWEVYHTLENRTNVDVAEMRKQRGNGRATLESFLNLELALSADAWVCNLSSNWCQLIDELRMTVGGKASAPYVHIVWKGYQPGENCKAFHRRCYIAW